MFETIKAQLADLQRRDEQRNGRYDAHVSESTKYRSMIDSHEQQLCDLKKMRSEIRIWALASLITFVAGCMYIGRYFNQIDVNTKRIDRMENIHYK
jgi:hypothetical protein